VGFAVSVDDEINGGFDVVDVIGSWVLGFGLD
jgi:hypothetical protein